jgi:predicted nucleic acid-binding protein
MKFIADTNLLSELIGRRPAPSVVRWVRDHEDDLVVSWVTIAELRKGVSLHPDGRRQIELGELVDRLEANFYDPQEIPLTSATATEFGSLVGSRKRSGQPISWPDTVIAAQAKELGLTVATRNTRDFPDVPTVNPWDEAGPGR